jgi:hypothetical protein
MTITPPYGNCWSECLALSSVVSVVGVVGVISVVGVVSVVSTVSLRDALASR